MNIKNINPFERHVEKAVILVAALFAGWVIYKNFVGSSSSVPMPGQPMTRVAPGEVGSSVIDAATHLTDLIRTSTVPFSPNHMPPYIKGTMTALAHPLPPSILKMPAMVLGPLNWPISAVNTIPGMAIPNVTFVVPVVPAPLTPAARQHRGVAVNTSQPSTVEPSPPTVSVPGAQIETRGAVPPTGWITKDVAWIKVSAKFPMAQWLVNLAGGANLKSGERGLPTRYQRTTFYRVQARRTELQPNGQWGSWLRVRGFYLNGLPVASLTNLSSEARYSALAALDRDVTNILTPPFYSLEQFQLRSAPVNQPAPGPGGRPQEDGQEGGRRGGMGLGGFPGQVNVRGHGQGGPAPEGLPGGRPRSYISRSYISSGGPVSGPPGSPQSALGQLSAAPLLASLLAQPQIPIWLYDTTVQPDKTYRYELRVVLYNPAYQLPWHLTVAATVHQAWLKSPWSPPSGVVHASNTLYFFLVPNTLARRRVEFRIFKWIHGLWASSAETVSPGQIIGNSQSTSLVDPHTGRLTFKAVDFNTGYTLVNVTANDQGAIEAVVLAPDGQLAMRNSLWDESSAREQNLMTKMIRQGTPQAAPGETAPQPRRRRHSRRNFSFRGNSPGGD